MRGRRAAIICLEGWDEGVIVRVRVLMWGVERRRELSVDTGEESVRILAGTR